MKIELFYDPIQPETDVTIDGQRTEGKDIFGFLYPVKSYLIQAWLPESGAWSGLRQQLRELARGEAVELCFYGRQVDFEDMKTALKGAEGLELRFHPRDIERQYQERLTKAEALLEAILSAKVLVDTMDAGTKIEKKVYANLEKLFPETHRHIKVCREQSVSSPWMRVLSSQAELASARRESTCCLLREPLLPSYDSLSRLESLTGAMQRCPEMLCCEFVSEEKLREFERYAAQFPGQKPCFALMGAAQWKARAEQKYGIPFSLRQRLTGLQEAFQELSACYGEERVLRESRKALEAEKNTRHAGELNLCRWKLSWLANQRTKVEEFRELLDREPTWDSNGKAGE